MPRKKKVEAVPTDVVAEVVLAEETQAHATTDTPVEEVPAAEVPPQDSPQATPVKPKLVRVSVEVGLLHYVNRFYSKGDTLQVPEDLAADLLKSGYVRY